MTKLSIIVPVYKTEKYINRCIDSILCQGFQDFELILVDDGSPDKCPQICDEYEKKDSRVKVIHKKNAGVAAARNTGLDEAVGDFVTFVDSDDWIESNMYSEMLDIQKKYNCDLVVCDCVKEQNEHCEVYTHDIEQGFLNYEKIKSEYYKHLLMMENVEYPLTISNNLCLIKREYIKDVRYVDGVRFSEDLLFGAEVMTKIKSFYYMKNKTYYHYCINPTSATHTFTPNKWDDYKILYYEAKKRLSLSDKYDFSYQIELMLLFFVYNSLGDIFKTTELSKKEKMNIIKKILNEDIVKKMFNKLSIHKLKISWKLKLLTYLYKYRCFNLISTRCR